MKRVPKISSLTYIISFYFNPHTFDEVSSFNLYLCPYTFLINFSKLNTRIFLSEYLFEEELPEKFSISKKNSIISISFPQNPTIGLKLIPFCECVKESRKKFNHESFFV